jgi:endogenous inhibitor of DNA gyrase (YacG/DUF329 family)
MIQGRCPTCARAFAIAKLADLPSFPFCSDRCRLIDLGRWIDGAYTIPGPESPSAEDPAAEQKGAPAGDDEGENE